ncbi:serine/threonine protein kinase [Actinomadura craniellae]|uniref:Serine/threonine protein kinase n=1 Tax=Actinomadura craniellae TaxID=2231787 RepID=A0A365GZH4_9ACTN|nr:serine/threonine-protein kinase [Actinomadura craniellae]RAY12217.1 serine/threonine protein kinase [Actinomadura craniellae]
MAATGDSTADRLQPGDPRRLGAYELIGRLGTGGQGSVYLGRAADGRQVAVKLLHGDLADDTLARERFVREASAAMRVARFCAAQVLDADVEGARPYIVSEYVPGPSLQKFVRENGPVSGAALERLAIGTATALVAIHQAGIVHRDLKPANVLLAPDGPRVIDFGIAKALDSAATLSSRVVGTPAYMAPEQLSGARVTPAVDVFAWGVTLAYVASGRPPFGQDSIPLVANRIMNMEPDLGDLEGPLRTLVADCLAKDPARRPTARDILFRLISQQGAVPAAAPAEVGTEILAQGATLAAPLPSPAGLGLLGAAVAGETGPQPAGQTERIEQVAAHHQAGMTAPGAADLTAPAPGGNGGGPKDALRRAVLAGAGGLAAAAAIVALVLLLPDPDSKTVQPSRNGSSAGVRSDAPVTGGPAYSNASPADGVSSRPLTTSGSPSTAPSGGTGGVSPGTGGWNPGGHQPSKPPTHQPSGTTSHHPTPPPTTHAPNPHGGDPDPVQPPECGFTGCDDD